jgi:hypothetical protein
MADTDRNRYWMWQRGQIEEPDGPLVANLNALVAQGAARWMPEKEEMRRAGPEALLDGFLPAEPLIGPDTNVIAIGSCFAGLFAEWLVDHGYNRYFDSTPEESLVRSPLETPLAVAQQFRWAFGEFDSDLAFWFTPDKRRVEATEARRAQLRRVFAEADVIVITLGLAETWIDRESGEAIWRLPPREHRSDRYVHTVTSVHDAVGALETIDRLRRDHAPGVKIVYTVSPVRFTATFRPFSPVVANVASKAIVRASLDEFLRAHAEDFNETYFYFPSYEIVTQLMDDPYEDNRHVHPHHSAIVLDLFARHYTTFRPDASPQFPESVEAELRQTIAHLEETRIAELRREIEFLQFHCDERLKAIDLLNAACGERLARIEQLERDLARALADPR